VQPAPIIVVIQSQQAWIMSQQALSPVMQVMQTPSAVISHLHIPIVRLQQHTIAPFIMQQQPHFELAIMLQRCCSIEHDTGSSQLQVIFMPPVHFSIFIWQRGIIIPVIAGLIAGIALPIPAAIIPGVFGFVAVVIMAVFLRGLIPGVPRPPWPRLVAEVMGLSLLA
jgi:hypothetical protein